MKNLLETYENYLSNLESWKYYDGMGVPLPDLFIDRDSAKKFIVDYFNAGEKNAVFDTSFSLDETRLLHIISTFFLGIHLSEIILGDEKTSLEPDFNYLWYLTSLYHDYGYHFEDSKDKYLLTDYKDLKTVINNRIISYDLLSSQNSTLFPKPFDIDTISNYYRYCIKERGTINHGIIGGLLFYDRLVRNFHEVYKEHYKVELNPKNPKDDFVENGLNYRYGHIKTFAKIARKIIIHNIWFCTPQENGEKCKYYDKYKEFKLSGLIINDDDPNTKKHRWSDDRFLFLLILTDTIEPIKFFKNLKPECVLKGISINTNKDSIEIKILDKCINPKLWFKNILDLNNWMKISVKPDGDWKLTISKFIS